MHTPLFGDVPDPFFERMMVYLEKLDNNQNNNGVYASIMREAWRLAEDAHKQGHEKAWFYKKYIESHAEHIGLKLHFDPPKYSPITQLELPFKELPQYSTNDNNPEIRT